jgi:hypothetical protein
MLPLVETVPLYQRTGVYELSEDPGPQPVYGLRDAAPGLDLLVFG